MEVYIILFIIDLNKWWRRLKVLREKHSKRRSNIGKQKEMQLRL